MGTEARAAVVVQEMIEATQIAETIKYGQRAVEAMGGASGCTREFAGADWAIAQFEAAVTVAEFVTGATVTTQNAAWVFKRAAKVVRDRTAAAKVAKREFGTARQIRMAMAA